MFLNYILYVDRLLIIKSLSVVFFFNYSYVNSFLIVLRINEHQEIGNLENENIRTLVNTCVIVSHVHSGTKMTCTIASGGLTSTSTIQFQILAPKQILISRAVIIPAVYQLTS